MFQSTVVLCILLLALYSYACSTKYVIKQIMVTSITSILACILYSIMDSPDVAITEAAVNAAVSTVFLLLLLNSILSNKFIENSATKMPNLSSNYRKIIIFILSIALFAICSYIILLMPDYGYISLPANGGIADYYIKHTHEEIGVNNIVTAVLASYRGFDTLCETLVICIAALGVNLIVKDYKT